MRQVFILRCDWNIWGDTGHDIVGAYSSYESACRDLKVFVDNEKQTSLEIFFTDGVINGNKGIEDYEDKDNYFEFYTKDGEWFIEVYIECISIKD
jgi:hypothetical protein